MRRARMIDELRTIALEVDDILGGRVRSPEPPEWCERRGWTPFLLAMDEPTLSRCEHGDIARALAELGPPSLAELARRVIAATDVPRMTGGEPRALRRASERKRVQVAALAALMADRPRPRRIVDFGAGHGHLTRELAAALGAPALGIEARAHVVDGARRLTEGGVTFEIADASQVALEPGDLAVGLHACGALGDALIARAREARASVLLVSCCPQKIEGAARTPLSSRGIAIARDRLGLANLATLAQGGVGSAGVADRRRTRRALAILIEEAGLEIEPGEEMRGVHRRQLRKPFREVVLRAFAHRGLALPSDRAIDAAMHRASSEHDAMRRLTLPRAMLSRMLELLIVEDRAEALRERGMDAEVIEAFDRAASPRNLAIVGR